METANLIRQSIKDSAQMGIDHRAGLIRFFFLSDQTTIGRKLN